MKRLLAAVVALACLSVPLYLHGQSYTISPPPFLLAQNNSGAIINAACVWTYVAGTSTAATTYSNNTGTQNSNPIIADSAGRFTAFLIPGNSYKFVYESACTPPAHGTTLRTADNISAMPSAGGTLDYPNATAGEALSAGQAVYLSNGDGGKNAGQWYKADPSNAYSSTTNTVGIATAAIASGSTGLIRGAGSLTGLTSLTVSSAYYVGTSGALQTQLAANSRYVGQADTTTSLVMQANPPPFIVTNNGLPTVAAQNGNLLIGRASDHTMQLGNLTAGNGISIVGTAAGITISSGSFAHTKTTTSNPSLTASTAGVMMGLAGSITPTATGTVLFCLAGDAANSVDLDGLIFQMRFGTGAAPANGAALTGTAIGSLGRITQVVTANNVWPMGLGCVLQTGLTLNTAAWYDFSLGAVTGGNATATSVVMSAVELP